jgi:hypothetical protein
LRGFVYTLVQTLYLKFHGWTAKSYVLVDGENEVTECLV